MRSLVIQLVAILAIGGLWGCKQSKIESPLEIKFNSKTFISLEISNSKSSFNFKFHYFPNLSTKRLESQDFFINSDTTILIELIAHMPQQHNLLIEKTEIPFFITLEDTIKISFDCTNQKTTFTGANKSINNYLLSKNDIQQKIDISLRDLYHSYKMPYHEQQSQLDSLANILWNILDTTQISIPNWFRNLEYQNIEFQIAHVKLGSASYRNFLNPNEKDIPSNDNLGFINNLNLSSPYNQYLDEFYIFMNFYSFYLIYGNNYVNPDSVVLLFTDESLSTKMFEACLQDDLQNDNFLAFALAQTIIDIAEERERRNERIEYLKSMFGEESSALIYLTKENSKIEQYNLKSGDQAPKFYLEDLNGGFQSLDDQKGKVVLLNFYNRGCIACVKEVPYEKELQAKYGSKFQIINVCHTDSKNDFKKAVEKFQLDGLNVYTQGNWKKILKKKYMLHGYPHYTLIDKDGQIVKNNTYKPSNKKLETLIESVL